MIEAVVTWLADAFVAFLIGAGVSAAPWVGWVALGAAYAVTGAALMAISSALAPDIPSAVQQAQRILKSYKGTASPRRVIYGQLRCGGDIVFETLTGTNGIYYWRVIVLGVTNGAPYESITKVYFDDEEYDLATDFTANVINTGKYYNTDAATGRIMVTVHLGADDQTADSALSAASSDWTANHIGKGVVYAVVRFERDDDIFSHMPEVTFLVKGAKVYDPRLDSTNGGSGSHRDGETTDSPNPALTWEWSDNPALILRDYIRCSRYGMGEDKTRINDVTVAASANTCDELVSVPPVSSPVTQQARYACNGAVYTSTAHAENLSALRAAMLGVITYSRGKYKLMVGEYTAPTVTLTDDDVVGSIRVSSVQGDAIYNAVRGRFLDANKKYQLTSYNARTDSTYVTEDNGETIWKDYDQPMVLDEYNAQRNAEVILNQSRNKLTVNASFNLKAYAVEIWDTVAITNSEFGWTGKVFRVLDWTFDPSGYVQLRLQEESSSAWATPAVGDYALPGNRSATSNQTVLPLDITGVSATGVAGGIVVAWDEVDDGFVRRYEVGESATQAYGTPTIVWAGYADSHLVNFATPTTRYYWVRARKISGPGRWCGVTPEGNGVGATSLSAADGADGNSSIVCSVYKRSAASPAPATPSVDDGSYNFDTATLTPPTGWSATPPAADGNPLWVSTGIFEISGTSGTDNTVTWSAPALLVTDGADGAPGSPGNDGDDGISSIVCMVYKRSASAPSTPAVDDGSYNFSTSTLTPPSTWSTTPPASDGNPLYVSTGLFEIIGTIGTDSTVTWTAPALMVSDGADGAAGNSSIVCSVYKRSAASPAPATPTLDDGSYNFSTGTLTPPTGWSATPPASDGNPLWVSTGIFEISGTTGTDNTVTWTAPALIVSDGADGATGTPGNTTFFASVFKRAADSPVPATPSGGSYNFTSQTLTAPAGWSVSPPAQDGNPLWVSNAIFEITGTTGTDNSATWTGPAILASDGVDGAAGTPGNTSIVCLVYKRAASPPSTPAVDDGSYNFSTKTLTPPSTWSTTPPASDGNPLYSSTGIFEISGTTGTDNTVTWSAPAVLVSDGTDGSAGAAGNSSIVCLIYKRSASAPSTPSVDDGSYNFTSKTLTPATGWSATPPASDGNPLYSSTGIFEIAGTTGTDNTVTWTTPALLVSDGADGAVGTPGNSSIICLIYKRSASPPSTPSVDDGSYNFTSGTLTPATGWSATPPASDGNPLYISSGVFEISGSTGTDNTVTWTAPALMVSDGADGSAGSAGNSSIVCSVYKRSASTPSTPSVDDGSYNFTTATLTPPSTWSTTPPASDGNPLYVSSGIFEISGTSGTDNTVTWSAPALLVSDGTDGSNGSDGLNVAVAFIYQRTTTDSAPTLPSATVTYTFATGGMTGLNNGWTESVPSFTGSNPYLWVSIATASNTAAQDSIGSGEWDAAQKLSQNGTDGSNGTNGTDGDDGLSVHVSTVYKRSSSAPSTPTGGSYNFTTTALTAPSTWSEAVPAANGVDLYASSATWAIVGQTGTDSSTTWSTPVLVQEGNITLGALEPNYYLDATHTGQCYVEFIVKSNGELWGYQSHGAPTSPANYKMADWIGNAAAGLYECRVRETYTNSIGTESGTQDTWIDCSTADANRTWRLTTTFNQAVARNWELDFRRTSDNVILHTAVMGLTAEDV